MRYVRRFALDAHEIYIWSYKTQILLQIQILKSKYKHIFFFLWKQTAGKVPRNSVIKCHHLFDQRLVNILCITIFWLSGCLNNQLPSTQKWKRRREIVFIYNLWKNKSSRTQNQACLAIYKHPVNQHDHRMLLWWKILIEHDIFVAICSFRFKHEECLVQY